MSARDDYPAIASLAGNGTFGGDECTAALVEIDRLRCDVTNLLARLASAQLMMRIASDPKADLWKIPMRAPDEVNEAQQ